MKRLWIVAAAAMLCLLLTGCDLWMDGSYHSVEPHDQEYSGPSLESAEVTSYMELKSVLVDIVSEGSQQSVIYMIGFDQSQMSTIMNMAIDHIIHFDPIGSYAVEKIDYEIGNNTGRTAIAVKVSYIHNRSEILRIRKVADMDEARGAVAEALKDCETGVVLQVENYDKTDFAQYVQDHVEENPLYCMEMPQVNWAVYPDTGLTRVIELTFTYQTSRESLRMMQNYVQPVFRAADLNVSGEEDELTKFTRTFSFLMERTDYTLETSITPIYSLLRHGVGDSKAFATVYAAMCRQADLECKVVTGTKEGEPWVWNMICVDGVYAHVDLLESLEAGRMQVRYQNEMDGYVWDYSAYPEAIRPEIITTTPTEPQEPDVTEPTREETEDEKVPPGEGEKEL